MNYAKNVAKCQRCLNRQRQCHGACACLHDGKDIIDHAKSDQCPIGRFGKRSNPVVEYVGVALRYAARPTFAIPDDYEPEFEVRRLRTGGCCGAPTQP